MSVTDRRTDRQTYMQNRRVPILYYGLEACPLRKAELNVLDFVINRFFMKLFGTNHIRTVNDCQMYFFSATK